MFTIVAAACIATMATAAGDSAASRPVVLSTATGNINGTELVPPGAGKHPVILIVPGSGPTDRDGNSPVPVAPGKSLHTDAYRLLASALASRGIASVRYDKRGIAGSVDAMQGHNESDYRFDTGIDDAAAWIRKLRADPRFSKLIVVGHSEGSLIGMVAAARERADGFVSLEGAGRPASVVIREQLAARGVPVEMYGRVLDSLEAGRTVSDPPAALAALFRPSVQPYLISWFRYDPVAELREFRFASLVIQGTHDLQTTVADGKLLGSVPGAKLLLLDGMTHVLKDGPQDPAAQFGSVYTDPAAPLDSAMVAAIVSYVGAAPRPR